MQPRLAALQPPVLADRRLGQRAARLDREQRERPQRLLLGRRRRVEPLASGSRARPGRTRAGSSGGRRSRARRGPRAPRAPSSPASSSTSRRCPAALEVARAERPFGADPLEHRLDEVAVLAQRAVVRCRQCPPPLHHAAKVRPQLDRQQRRLVRPVLEDPPLAQQALDRVVAGRRRSARTSVSRCARSTVEIESSCTADSRRIAASTSSASRPPEPRARSPAARRRAAGPPRVRPAVLSRGARGTRAGRSA